LFDDAAALDGKALALEQECLEPEAVPAPPAAATSILLAPGLELTLDLRLLAIERAHTPGARMAEMLRFLDGILLLEARALGGEPTDALAEELELVGRTTLVARQELDPKDFLEQIEENLLLERGE
jgi:hypothetical protein